MLAISSVSAGDLDGADEIAVNEDISDDLIISDDELITKDSSNVLSVSDVDEDNLLYDDNLKIKGESNLSDSISVSGNTFEDIQNAIKGANEGDTIKLSGTYIGNGSVITISKPLTISGADNTVLDAKGLGGIFYASSDVVFKNLMLIGVKDVEDSSNGGAIYFGSGNCSVLGCDFVNCSASNGGAIYLRSCNSSVVDCRFINCSANSDSFYDYGGGAIYAGWNYCNASFVNCSFIDNSAKSGGAIYFGSGDCSVVNCRFVNNSASTTSTYTGYNYGGYGGAILCSMTNISISHSSFSQNTANRDGGALYLHSSSRDNPYVAIIQDSNFTLNAANNSGGAIYNEFELEIESCNFESNSAYSGGAIWSDNGYVETEEVTYYDYFGGVSHKETIYYKQQFSVAVSGNCSFINNSAIRYGGAIYMHSDYSANRAGIIGILDIYEGSEFYDNSAGTGGAISVSEGNCSIAICDFVNNTAQSGGALRFYESNVVLGNCSFYDHSASEGGAVSCLYGDYFFADCSFVNNSVMPEYDAECHEYFGGCGGAVNCFNGNYAFTNCSFVNNSAFSKYDPKFKEYCGGIGSAIYFYDGICSVVDCGFVNNSAGSGSDDGSGGAVYFQYLNGIFSGCNFNNNRAVSEGGAIGINNFQFYSYEMHNLTLTGNAFESNAPDIYGGLISLKDNVLSVNTPYSNGSITVKINGKVLKEDISSNKTSFNLNGIPEGTYDANIYYSGNDEYNESYLNIPLIIESGYMLESSDLTKYYGGSEKFTVKLTNDNNPIAGAKVKITVNGKESTVTTDSKGQASLDINLAPGTYDAVSEYEGISKSSKITVKSTLTASDSSGTYLNSKVSATFLNTNGKALSNTKVSFKVGSKTYTATTNNNGVATASIDLDVGNYTVTAINPKNNEQKTVKLSISKAKSSIALTATSNNGEVILTASLSPSTASGNVVFNLNNKNYTVKINNSKASQTISGLKTANYTAKATYAGDKNLNSSSASTKITVKKVTPTKIIYEDMTTGPVPKSAGRIGNYFCVKLVDDKGKAIAGVPIKIGFNGVIYNRTTESDGGARLQINLANEDLYTFAICF